ncbi:MAG: FlgD immunoglobulin-like domain containing protein, partial [bacterium]
AVSVGAFSIWPLSVNVAVNGTGFTTPTTVTALGPVSGGSNLVALYASPVAVLGTAVPTSARVGTMAQVEFEVLDSCNQGVPNRDLTLSVLPSDAVLGSSQARTASDGKVRTSLRLSAQKGRNTIRADVVGAAGVSGTLEVDGTVPPNAVPYLSQNVFDPGRGDVLKVRTYVPAAVDLSVRVYNIAGELVRVVKEASVVPGLTEWSWDGKNDGGSLVGNGVYFIQVVMGSDVQIKRVVVLKR